AAIGIRGDDHRNRQTRLHLLRGGVERLAELHDVQTALTQRRTHRRAGVGLTGLDLQLDVANYFLCHWIFLASSGALRLLAMQRPWLRGETALPRIPETRTRRVVGPRREPCSIRIDQPSSKPHAELPSPLRGEAPAPDSVRGGPKGRMRGQAGFDAGPEERFESISTQATAPSPQSSPRRGEEANVRCNAAPPERYR